MCSSVKFIYIKVTYHYVNNVHPKQPSYRNISRLKSFPNKHKIGGQGCCNDPMYFKIYISHSKTTIFEVLKGLGVMAHSSNVGSSPI